LDEIIESPDFESGLKFHAYLDSVRETLVLKMDLYSLFPDSQFVSQALKFVEDSILYSKISDWGTIVSYFDKVYSEELTFGIPEPAVANWHSALQNYFKQRPNENVLTEFFKTFQFPDQVLIEILTLYSEISQNAKFVEYVETLYASFEDLI
jgi:hypothetical protein